MKRYVAGLLFSEDKSQVVLIHKLRGPAAVVGKWNAIGGKIEESELEFSAMQREFFEEAGVDVNNWTPFLILSGKNWEVTFFHCFDDKLFVCRTMEEEEVFPFLLNDLPEIVPNLRWIIPMALGHQDDHVMVYSVQEYITL